MFVINSPDIISIVFSLIPVFESEERQVSGQSTTPHVSERNLIIRAALDANNSQKVDEVLGLLTSRLKLLIKQTLVMASERDGYSKICGVGEFISGSAHKLNANATWRIPAATGATRCFITCSPLQEADLMVFIMGCVALIGAISLTNTGKGGTVTKNMAILAARCFDWRASMAPQNQSLEYDSAMPPYLQSYYCRALQYLALSVESICDLQARPLETLLTVDTGVAELSRICFLMKKCNENAAKTKWLRQYDGDRFVLVISAEYKCYTEWLNVYTALYHLVESGAPKAASETVIMGMMKAARSNINNPAAKTEIDRLTALATAKFKTYAAYAPYRVFSWALSNIQSGSSLIDETLPRVAFTEPNVQTGSYLKLIQSIMKE